MKYDDLGSCLHIEDAADDLLHDLLSPKIMAAFADVTMGAVLEGAAADPTPVRPAVRQIFEGRREYRRAMNIIVGSSFPAHYFDQFTDGGETHV